MVVMKLIRWANRRQRALACAGQYVLSVDVQKAPTSMDWLVPTPDIHKAKRWENSVEAMKTYREILKSDPLRPDGKPNRPMTAIQVDLINYDEEGGDEAA